MKARTIAAEDLDASLLATWRGFQAADATLSSPFLAPEITAAFGRHLPRARIGIIEDGRRVVGFLPHEAHALGIVKALGYGYTDCQGLIAKPGGDWDNVDLLDAFGFSTSSSITSSPVRQTCSAPAPRSQRHHPSSTLPQASTTGSGRNGSRTTTRN